jgi:hypothetical protein
MITAKRVNDDLDKLDKLTDQVKATARERMSTWDLSRDELRILEANENIVEHMMDKFALRPAVNDMRTELGLKLLAQILLSIDDMRTAHYLGVDAFQE